jgi:hypothetical protein
VKDSDFRLGVDPVLGSAWCRKFTHRGIVFPQSTDAAILYDPEPVSHRICKLGDLQSITTSTQRREIDSFMARGIRRIYPFGAPGMPQPPSGQAGLWLGLYASKLIACVDKP